MHKYVLSLGANLGRRLVNLRHAVRQLARRGEVLAVSSVWETAPLGMKGEQPAFLNCALSLDTYLDPRQLLAVCKQLEERAGRNLDERYRSRPLDIDIISWSGGSWHDDQLVIPHPRATKRKFVVIPYNEVSPTALPEPEGDQEIEFFSAADSLFP
jgi:2-amino-4-hydroxy-6-hydroxymethyldihydropteridine diphosphokinase